MNNHSGALSGSREPSQSTLSRPVGFDPERGFEEWWSELEGFSLRCERAADDLQLEGIGVSRLRAWLEAAYLTGAHYGLTRIESPTERTGARTESAPGE